MAPSMIDDISMKAELIFDQLRRDAKLSKYLDIYLPIPKPYLGEGPIKLFVLGQDPTVKNADSRQLIRTVLNLDRRGSVLVYLSSVCQKLGINLKQNIYATNLFKNFFVQPPTQIKESDIFQEFLPAWLPLLQEELALFPDIPVITLGQPVMQTLVKSGALIRVREYWGYTTEWEKAKLGPFRFIKPLENRLGRTIFPFPHQPSIRKPFYKLRKDDYTAYMKAVCFC